MTISPRWWFRWPLRAIGLHFLDHLDGHAVRSDEAASDVPLSVARARWEAPIIGGPIWHRHRNGENTGDEGKPTEAAIAVARAKRAEPTTTPHLDVRLNALLGNAHSVSVIGPNGAVTDCVSPGPTTYPALADFVISEARTRGLDLIRVNAIGEGAGVAAVLRERGKNGEHAARVEKYVPHHVASA